MIDKFIFGIIIGMICGIGLIVSPVFVVRLIFAVILIAGILFGIIMFFKSAEKGEGVL